MCVLYCTKYAKTDFIGSARENVFVLISFQGSLVYKDIGGLVKTEWEFE